jgi:hypothetical protein
MLKDVVSLVVAFFIIAGSTGHVLAEDVFITRTGNFYYPSSSPFIKTRATTRISREDAESKGYKPSKSYLKAKQKESQTPAASLQQQH